MSLNKSASQRLTLLAGASLAAAALAVPALAADTTTTVGAGVVRTTAVTASPTAPDTHTINVLGTLRVGTFTHGSENDDFIVIQGSGSGAVVINNDGHLVGRFDFTAATGPITVHVNTGGDPLSEAWRTQGVTTLGSGDDLIDITANGTIAAAGPYQPGPSPVPALATTIDFGAGNDRFVNAGRLIVEPLLQAGTITLTNLETFENSGLIVMGTQYYNENQAGKLSDRQVNDRLVAQGTDFIGSGASRIAMDVKLTELTQVGCPVTPTAADCIDFTGGSTAGSTLLTITDQQGLSHNGALNEGITLIVGSSAAEHFVLDPNSDFYAASPGGGMLQKKLVAYQLLYDDATDSHVLVGTLADEAFQSATITTSAQETWRSTAGSWLTRQADLRTTPGGQEGSAGVWGRLAASVSERDLGASYVQGAATHHYDLSHRQQNAHMVFGADLLRAGSGDAAAVFGGMVGFVRSDVAFDASPTETITNGFTGGVYASYVAGPLFVDGLFNVNLLHLTAEVPNMNLGLDVPIKQDIQSVGGQVEAGWRVDMGGGVFAEPLGGLAYVVTKIDDIDIPGGGGTFDFEDKYTSLRAGAGLRLGIDSQLFGMASSYSLTGRYWKETEAENAASTVVANGGTTVPLMDDFSGNFSELAGSVSLYSAGGNASAFVNLGGRFADDYRSIDGSVGVRLRW